LLDANAGDIEMGVMAEAPSWVRNVEATQSLFAMIHKKREDLSKQMGKSKRIGFDDEGEKQRKQQISALSDDISDLFKQCERNIQARFSTCVHAHISILIISKFMNSFLGFACRLS
jgi:hypothetical protein